MRLFGLGLVASCVVLGALIGACGDDPPEPGFEQVGGEGEGAGGPSTTGSGASSTKTTGGGTPSSSSSATNGSTSSASTTTGSSGCNDGGPGEPNNSESTAHDLGTIGDCDDEGGSVSGVLDGATDPDWYKYLGTDGSGCTTDPHRVVTSSHPIRICKFIQCLDDEENDFECPSGTMDANSPDGRPGCCATSEIDFSLTCGSSSINADEAYVYVRIDTTENECVTYTLTYDY